MDKLYFEGRLTAFAGDARDNDPFYKFTIKTKEEGTLHSLLSSFLGEDEGIEGAYKWANSPGYGKASFTLTTVLTLNVNFDIFEFTATLVSIAMSKHATEDLGTIVEYAFNFEKSPTDDNNRFWTSYLKQKEDPDTLAPDASGRIPKARALEYSVQIAVTEVQGTEVAAEPSQE